MPQQERIGRDIVFVGDAKHSQNVQGPMHETMHHLHDHFDQISLDTANWSETLPGSAGDSLAISAGVGGLVLLTLGNADNDSGMISSQIIFEADKNCICEARLKVVDITDTACFFGFTDAIGESNSNMAIAFEADTIEGTAQNAVGFVLDRDALTLGGRDEWLCCGVYGDTDAVNVSSGETAVSNTWVTLRVELKKSSDYAEAWFYINGVAVGYIEDSVATATDLCVAVHGENRETGVNGTIYIDRIDAWQDEN